MRQAYDLLTFNCEHVKNSFGRAGGTARPRSPWPCWPANVACWRAGVRPTGAFAESACRVPGGSPGRADGADQAVAVACGPRRPHPGGGGGDGQGPPLVPRAGSDCCAAPAARRGASAGGRRGADPGRARPRRAAQGVRDQTRAGGPGRSHGLRHAYAPDRQEGLTGWKASAAGGPARSELTDGERRIDAAARLRISRELGRGRLEIVRRYCGIAAFGAGAAIAREGRRRPPRACRSALPGDAGGSVRGRRVGRALPRRGGPSRVTRASSGPRRLPQGHRRSWRRT